MGRGIKLSKTIIFDIIYHNWEGFPGLGNVEMVEPYERDFIAGLGQDPLADCKCNDVVIEPVYIDGYTVRGFNESAPVYLQMRPEDTPPEGTDRPAWNRIYENNKFDGESRCITDDDFDDVDLYAKWVQYIWKTNKSFELSYHSRGDQDQTNISVNSGDLLFSWGSGNSYGNSLTAYNKGWAAYGSRFVGYDRYQLPDWQDAAEGGDWCAEFVWWCMWKCGDVSSVSGHSLFADAFWEGVEYGSLSGTNIKDGAPQEDDIISFWRWDASQQRYRAPHVGIVTSDTSKLVNGNPYVAIDSIEAMKKSWPDYRYYMLTRLDGSGPGPGPGPGPTPTGGYNPIYGPGGTIFITGLSYDVDLCNYDESRASPWITMHDAGSSSTAQFNASVGDYTSNIQLTVGSVPTEWTEPETGITVTECNAISLHAMSVRGFSLSTVDDGGSKYMRYYIPVKGTDAKGQVPAGEWGKFNPA